MSKRKPYEVDKNERYKRMSNLFEMVVNIKSKKEAADFFKDLLTPSEALMLSNRIIIAKKLMEGFSYEDIRKELGVGYTTINNVNRWLYTGFGGYLRVIKEAQNKKDFVDSLPKNEWESIKKKHPAHFLIFNLVDKFKSK
ncbi:MAG: YerC/YecD family TrpR-related protein [Candidatus Moraniibacteriota bacterium]